MKHTSLKKNSEFSRIYKKGKSRVHPFLVTYVYKRRDDTLRVGITASKKTGNAVLRNRARRVIKAALANCGLQGNEGVSIVFVARGATALKKSYEIENVMKNHLKELGVLAYDK